ncbi:hypothetical protein UFOVP17_15 [uncultured Caudovirales phage]|uniref:Uncharacterized protein n=1 Tax=uncultured Caudovirales phage TaxID=2100421 RepID=A0A6J5KL13_9CAUD|nr:hypothetical protein UFOVP17_15 [uncultured Caudovirales phage]
MTSKNDITGDLIKTKPTMGKEFEAQFEKIFGVKPPKEKYVPPPLPEYSEDWQSEKRDKAIAQNGNVGYSQNEIDQ